MSNKKVLITLSFVKNLIKELNDADADADADETLKQSKQYCFDIPHGKQVFFRNLKLNGFAVRATRHSILLLTTPKLMPKI